ncbi:endoglucanase E-4 precursor [Saccharicrinis fermentans DSM 9555 = JCM 21142]|uniref:Endoglucanase n=1 Tax=Saccharicrinis fermentans DSM 9555 = JCM 21142 TaxID=869213 RepID=W7YB89_9BACT|nr:endoglucanase E-4 precursor [Saccharicrinis fermentans DSM 9555 = JCM 21142]
MPAEVIDIRSTRLSYKIDAANPGSDLAGETAAALAAASLAFQDTDASYAATLLDHAKELYSFADNYRGKYTDVIPAGSFYNSWSGYQDELCWGAIWLYKATEDESYLSKAKTEYALLGNQGTTSDKDYSWTLAWDNKQYGCYVLMAALTGESEYNQDAERHLDQWFTDRPNGIGPSFTGSGFPILDAWGSFRYAANTAFLLLEQSDNMTDASKQAKYRDRAKELIDYMLGDNPQDVSYVIGYGPKYPMYPHHRTAHASWCRDESVPVETRHTLYGALVGGHKSADDMDWTDDRSDYVWNEVATDYNSLFTGVVARLCADHGGSILADFPQAETPNGEFLVEAKLNASGDTFSEYAIWVHNRTAWPARIPGSFKYRLFFDISEGIDAGYSASDYIVSANGSNATYSELLPADAANSIYYVEVTYNSDQVIYPGGQSESKRETQIRVRLPYEAPASAWNPSNDWSYEGVGSSLTGVPNIPLYADGELVYGNEPGPVEDVDVTGVTISPSALTINKGQTGTLTASVLPTNATNKSLTWSTSNEGIATVTTSGVVTAIAEGSATITATSVDGNFEAVCTVTVTDIVLPTYTLSTDTLGKGSISISPTADVYDEGTVVTLTAQAEAGYTFSAWTGDITGSDKTVTLTMNSNKSVVANFVPNTSSEGYTTISITYKHDGEGEFYWETTDEIDYVNSWNLATLEINGVDFTNTWSNSMPAKIDGKYQIYYKGSYAWSHAEFINGDTKSASGATSTNKTAIVSDISFYPNPATDVVTIDNVEDMKSISIYSVTGAKVAEELTNKASSLTINVSDFKSGMYIIKALTVDDTTISKVLIIQ